MVQPNILRIEGADYRIYTDENNVNFHGARIQHYARRRVFNLAVDTPKTIDFSDLQGDWSIDSLYISSPVDSEITVEILDQNNIAFYSEKYVRETTPRTMPTVLVNNTIKMRLTAGRSNINLLLLHLKPAYLAYNKDF